MINKFQRALSNLIMYLLAVFAESVLGYGSFIFANPYIHQDMKKKFGTTYNNSIKTTLGLSKNTVERRLCLAARVMTWE